ncbi:uncharacterized protein LOC133512506 [Syngnathoides biaculeatus]|uniref:uncharacterized protein LOC133512506 n=1 Tax=Syngnathoides biaculeatus TaxID=300417 RepID=UPI002ADE0752|nr:uncharacterized protein LOC133512506 [Syngnathoides biaculeatus]
MGFFQQVKLLLWKNGLNIVRNPVWSLTLVIWPLIIFIIVAVTRDHYPPVLHDSCYVAPRNLPSAGFFPFLQTLMCNADSKCYNQSRLTNPSKFTKRDTDDAWSTQPSKGSLLASLIKGGDFYSYTFPNDSSQDIPLTLEKIWQAVHQGHHRNSSVSHRKKTTLLRDQEALYKTMEAMNVVKRAICSITLTAINTSSPSTISDAVVTFCISNNTVVEFSLLTLNQRVTLSVVIVLQLSITQRIGSIFKIRMMLIPTELTVLNIAHILKEEILTEPDELAKVVGGMMLVFQEMQNHTSLWESLLAIPQLFSAGSREQMLDTAVTLLANIQGNMNAVSQFSFPQTMFLLLDRDLLYSYICDNSSNPLWLTTMCITGTLDTLLGSVSPDKVVQQALLAWSKHVAPHDVSFVKGLLHSLLGEGFSGGMGGSNISRSWRNGDTPPQNIEEELFLTVGQVVLRLSEIHPDVDMIVQRILSVGFQSMEMATYSIDAVKANPSSGFGNPQLLSHMQVFSTSLMDPWSSFKNV